MSVGAEGAGWVSEGAQLGWAPPRMQAKNLRNRKTKNINTEFWIFKAVASLVSITTMNQYGYYQD
jgi:hypothetical protein